jgi:hypothetical protein
MSHIKINDKEYDLSTASKTAKVQLLHLQAIDLESNRLNTIIAIMQTARGNYLRDLQEELEKTQAQAVSAYASGSAGPKIHRIIPHPINADHLQLRTGRDHRRAGPQFAPCGNAADLRTHLSQKPGLVRGLEIPMHVKGGIKRNLIPFRVGADLQDVGFCHGLFDPGLTVLMACLMA